MLQLPRAASGQMRAGGQWPLAGRLERHKLDLRRTAPCHQVDDLDRAGLERGHDLELAGEAHGRERLALVELLPRGFQHQPGPAGAASGGAGADEREPFTTVRFTGEMEIVTELEAGPVEVVNLMARRGAAEIEIVGAQGARRAAIARRNAFALCGAGDCSIRLDGEDFSISHENTLKSN